MNNAINETEFLKVVQASPDLATAARRLKVTDQSVRARLDRIRLKDTRPTKMPDVSKMDNAKLEQYWHEAHANQESSLADHIFGEMCDRLQRRTRRRR